MKAKFKLRKRDAKRIARYLARHMDALHFDMVLRRDPPNDPPGAERWRQTGGVEEINLTRRTVTGAPLDEPSATSTAAPPNSRRSSKDASRPNMAGAPN